MAQAGPSEALDHIRDAIDVVDEEGGKCKKDVMEDLREIKDLLKDEDFDRASKRIRSVSKDADRCPARVEKLLKKAKRELEGGDDDRKADAAPKRPAGVPYADWHADCRDFWLIVEVARYNTPQKTLDQVKGMFAPACDNANGMGAANYPNGTMAKSQSGDWYYPNGTMSKSSTTWYYKNGTNAGGFDALVSQACSRSQAACGVYKLALNSTWEDWRTFAVVQLETRAR